MHAKYRITVTEAVYGPERNTVARKWETTDPAEARKTFLDQCDREDEARVILQGMDPGGWTTTLATAEINLLP
jgi:hypothetical protein